MHALPPSQAVHVASQRAVHESTGEKPADEMQTMNPALTASIASACLFAAVWLGIRLRRLLPAHHLSADTKDTVKLAMGLVATMSALLLGLLVSAAKGDYDTGRNEVIQMAAKISFLDRILAVYGPESADARTKFRAAVELTIQNMWPGEGKPSAPRISNQQATYAVYLAIQNLTPRDDMQRDLKAQAAKLAIELAETRALLLAQSVTAISKPMLIVVVCWLVVIFLSFSVLAPSNATANLALLISTISVSGAVFLILELAQPFGGLIQISKQPMLNALSLLGQ